MRLDYKKCVHDGCMLPSWCSFCGGVCILHCAGMTTRWNALWYFWKVWQAYCRSRR